MRRQAGDPHQRLLALLADPPVRPDTRAGYLDVIGPSPHRRTGLADMLMNTATVPRIYERWWRPALGRLAKGVAGPSMREERRIVHRLLVPRPGDVVLDVGCGPGIFTRDLATAVGSAGFVVGIDTSPTMLAWAVRATKTDNVAYLRADAVELPLADGSADGVCCFGALHLFDDPMRALDAMTRMLVPGGRIALLSTCRPEARPLGLAGDLLARLAGLVLFERSEISDALRHRGFGSVTQQVAGVLQFVGAVRGGEERSRNRRTSKSG